MTCFDRLGDYWLQPDRIVKRLSMIDGLLKVQLIMTHHKVQPHIYSHLVLLWKNPSQGILFSFLTFIPQTNPNTSVIQMNVGKKIKVSIFIFLFFVDLNS
jgi:hypothetical protein